MLTTATVLLAGEGFKVILVLSGASFPQSVAESCLKELSKHDFTFFKKLGERLRRGWLKPSATQNGWTPKPSCTHRKLKKAVNLLKTFRNRHLFRYVRHWCAIHTIWHSGLFTKLQDCLLAFVIPHTMKGCSG